MAEDLARCGSRLGNVLGMLYFAVETARGDDELAEELSQYLLWSSD